MFTMLQTNIGLKTVGNCVVECTLVFKQVPLRINLRIQKLCFHAVKKVLVVVTATLFAILLDILISFP